MMQMMVQLLPVALMVTVYVGVVIFILVLAWRGVRAHERIADSLERIAAGRTQHDGPAADRAGKDLTETDQRLEADRGTSEKKE
ncbi:hypothetical protein C8P63_10752 [Melghirimyces profundicolus]|uniref:Uncharacterized protein n=1 Tax=Melghirimyces profundicolus TaxID=1242148 RepID=A0A2T6BZ58_9BACL|nr:hypothetical protein [Melghirimyces profundicolus]PTX61257.1 hypothetical protein C8P63_10752 [Melghirimyces profundicolus]